MAHHAGWSIYGGKHFSYISSYDGVSPQRIPDFRSSKLGRLREIRHSGQGEGKSDDPMLQDSGTGSFHQVTREMPVYALVTQRGRSNSGSRRMGAALFPVRRSAKSPATGFLRNLFRTKKSGGRYQNYRCRSYWSRSKVSWTGPLVDRTGLIGAWDVHLVWSPDANPDDDTGPSIYTALQEQLGLKLESTKGPVQVLVIDHVERPSKN